VERPAAYGEGQGNKAQRREAGVKAMERRPTGEGTERGRGAATGREQGEERKVWEEGIGCRKAGWRAIGSRSASVVQAVGVAQGVVETIEDRLSLPACGLASEGRWAGSGERKAGGSRGTSAKRGRRPSAEA